jgi:hypothetical protein
MGNATSTAAVTALPRHRRLRHEFTALLRCRHVKAMRFFSVIAAAAAPDDSARSIAPYLTPATLTLRARRPSHAALCSNVHQIRSRESW